VARLNRIVLTGVFAWALAGGAAVVLRPAPAPAADEKPHAAAASFEMYKDRAGEFRWRLRSQNKQILATSGESYKAKRDCLHSIESVKRAAAEAPVEELPEAPAPSK
jgi:hypothetical protein